MKRSVVTLVAFVTAVALLAAGCDVTHNVQPQLESTVGHPLDTSYEDAPAAQGQPIEALGGATQAGYDAAIEGYVPGSEESGASAAVLRCPSVRDPAMPPCTQWAGASGAYAAGAYVCVAGHVPFQGFEYRELIYPTLRTCMDGYISMRADQVSTTTLFYVTDLYRYWRVGVAVMDMYWAMVTLYVDYWYHHNVLVVALLACLALTSELQATAVIVRRVVITTATAACGTGLAVVRDAIFG